MRKLFASVFILILFTSTIISQTFDSSNVIIIDNGVCADLCNTENYIEVSRFAPWTTSTLYAYNGDYRLLAASDSGTHREVYVQYKFPIPADDYYLLYAGIQNSFNTGPTYFTLHSGSRQIDSLIYTPDNSPIVVPKFTWNPIGIYYLSTNDSFLTVERGLDSTSFDKLRVDAVALVRSTAAGPDIEIGKRPYSYNIAGASDTLITDFYSQREVIDFPITINEYNYFAEKTIELFNLGTEDLVVDNLTFGTNVFMTDENFPISISPGKRDQISVRFMPDAEGYFYDTIFIHSNDSAEQIAKVPLIGEGINYNFILNASENGSEPHWNIPDESGNYFEVDSGWANSTAMNLEFPIAGGNTYSRISVSNAAEAFFSFVLPDSLAGEYFIDGSPFPFSSSVLIYKTDIYTSADTFKTFYNSHNYREDVLNWCAVGDTNEAFYLPPGLIEIRIYEPSNSIVRLDLLRFRKKSIATEIQEENPQIISSANLFQNYPNPFNPKTRIKYEINVQQFLAIKIYDVLGEEISTLVNETKLPGSYEVEFDASSLSSGIYFYSLISEGKLISKKMLLLK